VGAQPHPPPEPAAPLKPFGLPLTSESAEGFGALMGTRVVGFESSTNDEAPR